MAIAIQLVGAFLVLTGFFLSQTGRWAPDAYPYLFVNLLGSIVLTACAAYAGQWGFVLLNGVWGTVAAVSIVRRWRDGPRDQRHDLISS